MAESGDERESDTPQKRAEEKPGEIWEPEVSQEMKELLERRDKLEKYGVKF
jgi:hypothetical protein